MYRLLKSCRLSLAAFDLTGAAASFPATVVNGNAVFLHAESHIVALKSRTAIESIVVKRARDRWPRAFETPN